MGSFYSKDGKRYDTYSEATGADEKYNNMIKQTNLLEQQLQNQKEHNEEMKRLEEEKMYQNELMNIEKRIHDKEMRLLGLFDRVSLNKKYYDEFIDYLFNEKNLKIIDKIKENKKTIDASKRKIKQIEKYLDGIIKFDDISYEILNISEKMKIEEKTDMYESFLKNHNPKQKDIIINKLNLKDNIEFTKLNNSVNKKNKIFATFASAAYILLFIGFLFAKNKTIALPSIILMFFSIVISLYAFFTSDNKKLYSIIDREIEQKLYQYKNEDNQKKAAIEKKESLKNKINYLELQNEENKKRIEGLKNKWNDFVEFRKNHYNIDLESLFIEAGLEDKITSIGLDFNRLNSSNAIKNGTVEDYIIYFNNIKKN